MQIKQKIILCAVTLLCTQSIFANPTSTTDDLKQQRIETDFRQLEQRVLQKIQHWENNLDQQDFEYTHGLYQLKDTEKNKLCMIFQDIIDEVYVYATNHKQDFKPQVQSVIADKNSFMNHLGIVNQTLNTQMGFDCFIN